MAINGNGIRLELNYDDIFCAELRPFASEEELEAFVEDSEIPLTDKTRKEKIGAAIIFGPAFQRPNETLYDFDPSDKYRLNYTIRIPLYTIDTSHLVGSLQLPGPQHGKEEIVKQQKKIG